MSSGFLSAAERERWQRFPETIPQDDLAVYFFLSDDDAREVNRQRDPFNLWGSDSPKLASLSSEMLLSLS